MTNKRNEMAARFTKQRLDRQAAISRLAGSNNPFGKRTAWPVNPLIVVLVMGLLLYGISLAFTQPTQASELAQPVVVYLTSTSTTANEVPNIDVSPTPRTKPFHHVCTDVPNGRLHVRFTANPGGEVRGYLVEGETVQLAIDLDGKTISEKSQDSQWLYLTAPIEGWVNSEFICKGEPQ